MRDVILLLLGALATGVLRILFDFVERKRHRRAAARIIFGDIAVTEGAFKLIWERKQWPDLLDFGPTLEAWREHRADFAIGTTAVEWAKVGAFYSNLERTARMIRPGEPCTEGDLNVAKMMVEYAESAFAIAVKHVARTEKERKEVVDQLGW